MNRTLRVKRLWSMGQFNNIELYDEVSDIPQDIALNSEAIELLYQLMIMEQEVAHKNYLQVFKEHPVLLKMFPDILDVLNETLLSVKQQRARTFEQFMKQISADKAGQEKQVE